MKYLSFLIIFVFSCQILRANEIEKNDPPYISPSSTQNLCAGDSVILTVNNAISGSTFKWKKDGNYINNETRSSYTVKTAGSYTVEIDDGNGPTQTLNPVVVNYYSKPTADFSFSPTNSCGRTTISFTNNSNNSAGNTSGLTYSWSFGDNSNSTNTNPSHTYNPPAGTGNQSYVVRLIVTQSQGGCKDTSSQTLNIGKRPDATLIGPPNTYAIINGEPYFKICTAVGQTFTFSNGSTTSGTNSRYIIKWGDGTSNFDSSAFLGIKTHSYSVGLKKLTFLVYSGSCVDSITYNVFVGNIPAGGIAGVGGSTICAGDQQKFVINGTINNAPGTRYILKYKDGTVNDTFYHPAPDTVSHIFPKSSCDSTSSNGTDLFYNSYGAYLSITNPCGSAGGSILPIYVSDRPKPDFTITPKDTICENQTIKFTNIGRPGNDVQNGVCTPGKSVWRITSTSPGASWSVLVGSIGSDNDHDNNPNNWTEGSSSINVQFNTPGTYVVTLIMGNNTLCGADSISKIICVNPTPSGSVTLDNSIICEGGSISATGTANNSPTCGNNIYVWSYEITANSTGCDNAVAPSITGQGTSSANYSFSKPGFYNIVLTITSPGGCSVVIKKSVEVKGKPKVSINSIASLCSGGSVSPSASVSCYESGATYSWTFSNASISNSSSSAPTVSYNTAGTYPVNLSVTNSCGTTNASTVNVIIKPIPDVYSLSDKTVCESVSTTVTTPTGSLSSTIFDWTNNNTGIGLGSSGTGSIPVFTAKNGTVNQISGLISVTPSLNGCIGTAKTFTIYVNPKPAFTISAPSSSICYGASSTLTSSISSNGGPSPSYIWSNGATTSNISVSPTSNTTYTLTVTNDNTCQNTESFNLTVKSLPTVSISPSSPTICEGGTVTLTASGASTYSWNPSTALNQTNTAAVIASPTTTTTYTVTGTDGNSCQNTSTVTVTVNPKPVLSVNSETICLNDSVTIAVTGANTYSWTPTAGLKSSNLSFTKASPTNSTTYTITGTNTTTGCINTISSTITVNPLPLVTVNNATICPGSIATLTASGADTYSWNSASGLSILTGTPVSANPTSTITYYVTGQYTSTGCKKTIPSVVTVASVPTILLSSKSNPTSCGGNDGSITFSGLLSGVSYPVSYKKNGLIQNVNATSSSSGILSITGLSSGIYSEIHINLSSCISNDLGPYTLSDPSAPDTPVMNTVQDICSASTLNISVSNPVTNGVYIWTGPNSYSNSGLNLTGVSITNAQTGASGTYQVTVQVAGCSSNAGSISATVNAVPLAPSATSPITYCQNSTASVLTATSDVGSTLKWYTVSTGGTAITNLPITPSTSNSGTTSYFVSQTNTFGCEGPRKQINVEVNPIPVISATFTSPTTCSGSEGEIVLSNFSANTSYQITYTKNGVSALIVATFKSDANGKIYIKGLSSGTYSDIFAGLNTCESNKVGPFTLNDPTPPSQPTFANISPVCSGSLVRLSVSSAVTNATYIWTDPNGVSSSTSISYYDISNVATSQSGIYTVKISINNCNSSTASTTLTVNPTPDPPVLSDTSYCQRDTPVALTAESYDMNNVLRWYNVSSGGTPLSNAPTPTTNTTTTQTFYASQITDKGCESIRKSLVVQVNPIPVISVQKLNPTTCGGNDGKLKISGTTPNTSYIVHYTKDGISYTPRITSDNLGIITVDNLVKGDYTNIFVELGSCTSNIDSATYQLQEPPKPDKPILTSNSPLCSGLDLNITVNNSITDATYDWKYPSGFTLTNSSQNILTLTNAQIGQSGTYFVQMISKNCKSDVADITVTVNQTPSKPAVRDTTYCQGQTAIPLTAVINSGNTLKWYTSLTGGSYSSTAPTPSTSSVQSIYYYVSQKSQDNCEGERSQIIVTINQTPSINDQTKTICSEEALNFTPVGAPVGTVYKWLLPTENPAGSITGGTAQSSYVALISQSLKNTTSFTGDITYTISQNIGSCPGRDFTLVVSVNPKPLIDNIVLSPICSDASFTYPTGVPVSGNIIPNGTKYTWNILSITPGSKITGATNETTPRDYLTQTLTNTSNVTGTVVYTVTPISGNCSGKSFTISINVYPKPKIGDFSKTICSGQSFSVNPTNADPATIVPATTLYTWLKPIMDGSDQSVISGGFAQSVSTSGISQTLINNTNSPQYLNYIITPEAGVCKGPDFKIRVLVNPQPNISPKNAIICSGQSFNVVPNDAPIGTLYTWSIPVVEAPGNVTGGLAQNTPVSSIGQILTNSKNFPAKVTYNVIPSSGSCGGSGFPVEVIVNPKPVIPTWKDTICNGATFFISPKNGENNSIIPDQTTFTWALPTSSPAGSITGGTAQSAAQSSISQTLYNATDAPGILNYIVTPVSGSYGYCVGSSFNLSIAINPDAKARYVPQDTIGCPPYLINLNKVGLVNYNLRNKDYIWYVDGKLNGSGQGFPNYTILNEDDTITLKLLTTSLYGCKSDSMFRQFQTYKLPHPSFTLSDSVGCGPLTVSFNNTTPEINYFTYKWNFGNGITSSSVQPSSVLYFTNPTFADTTYKVTLSVTSNCNVVSFNQNVRVKSKPKALFSPNKTIGCSPQRILFTNNSRGLNSRFLWDFGDGAKDSALVRDTISHMYYTSVRDTFVVKLYAINECGIDSMLYNIIIAPNSIKLDFAVNGTEKEGCVQHTVHFINNTSGASAFRWDFGDGNMSSSTKNIDTITHTYIKPGTYQVLLFATNGCTDTTSFETIKVFGNPIPGFGASTFKQCIGDTIFFNNTSTGADAYLWKYADGINSTSTNPFHYYSKSGLYNVKLIAYKTNAPGLVCVDSLERPVNIVDTVQVNYQISDSVSNCAPFKVTFNNYYRQNLISLWDFGDGVKQTGDSVEHTYGFTGTYLASLYVKTVGGCNLVSSKPISIKSPSGTVRYKSGFSCFNEELRFEAIPSATDSIIWDFGDGVIIRTTDRVIYHRYTNPGSYLPVIKFKSFLGCEYKVMIVDSIKVDKIKIGFSYLQEEFCGYTRVDFKDTSNVFFGKSSASWDFGDQSTSATYSPSHNYTSTNNNLVRFIIKGISGCSDTTFRQVPVFVRNFPSVQIGGDTVACTGKKFNLVAYVKSQDSISLQKWVSSSGNVIYGNQYSNTFSQQSSYSFKFISGTIYGCYDTTSVKFNVYPTPVVKAAPDVTICKGSSISITATGANIYSWYPTNYLSCIDCSNPQASPLQTSLYTVKGMTNQGCFSYDTIKVTVIPDFQMEVSRDDSICIGESIQLLASGATYYEWSPALGLSATNISNPIAKPDRTVKYRVVGFDEYGCFRDTSFILIGVGGYPKVDLGPDKLLATGTLFNLKPKYTEGPIKTWKWDPITDLNCTTCPEPVVRVRHEITYSATATNYYGCTGSDSITIKVFCEGSQVFIPNAFTPDGDGINDIFMIRASGIQSIKSFRIFTRWGDLIYDKANFQPNDPNYAWDGKIRGVVPGPDVFVYTVEVICDDGTPYFYKGNVSLLK